MLGSKMKAVIRSAELLGKLGGFAPGIRFYYITSGKNTGTLAYARPLHYPGQRNHVPVSATPLHVSESLCRHM